MDYEIKKFRDTFEEMAKKFSVREKRSLLMKKMTEDDRYDFFVQNMGMVNAVPANDKVKFPPYHGKRSDGELVFTFEYPEDAVFLYNYAVQQLGLMPGEVTINVDPLNAAESSVHFAPHVCYSKPEVILGVTKAFKEFIYPESQEECDLLCNELKSLEEQGNPLHDKKGNFASKSAVKDGGSWSRKGKQQSVKGLTKKGGLMLKFAKACGRKARAQGKNVKCWEEEKISETINRDLSKFMEKEFDSKIIKNMWRL